MFRMVFMDYDFKCKLNIDYYFTFISVLFKDVE